MSASHRNTVHLFAGDDARIERVIERGPFYAYDRCDDCGAEPRTTCMRPDNTPAVEVCDGRRLLLPGGYDDVQGIEGRSRSVTDGRHAPCRGGCGTIVRLHGTSFVTGGFCKAPLCRQKKNHAAYLSRRKRGTQ